MQAVTGINNSNDRQDFRRNGRETENVNGSVCTSAQWKKTQVNKPKQQKTTVKNIKDPVSQFNSKFLGKTIQNR